MAALTAARDIPPMKQEMADGGHIFDFVVGTDIIYAGAFVVAGSSGIVAAGGDLNVVGVALETVDNSAGASGVTCRCQVGGVMILPFPASAALDDIGKAVYADDDQLLTLTAGSNSHVGQIVQFIDTTHVAVRLGLMGAVAG